MADLRARISRIYHFTDRRNLPSIREQEGIFSLELLESAEIQVAVLGGDNVSQATDRSKGLHKYVHLCFFDKHPMEYRAREAGRIGESIFLHIDPVVLEEDGVKFVPGMANTTGMPIYDLDEALDSGLIDFDVLYTYMPWADADIQVRRQQAEKYEILIPDFVSINLIRNFPDG